MGQPKGPGAKPDPDDETKQLPPVSAETAEFIALDPSEDPVAEIASPSFPPSFRGYDRRAVDAYVLRVTEIVAELHASRSPRAAVKRALDRVGRETAGILQNARAGRHGDPVAGPAADARLRAVHDARRAGRRGRRGCQPGPRDRNRRHADGADTPHTVGIGVARPGVERVVRRATGRGTPGPGSTSVKG